MSSGLSPLDVGTSMGVASPPADEAGEIPASASASAESLSDNNIALTGNNDIEESRIGAGGRILVEPVAKRPVLSGSSSTTDDASKVSLSLGERVVLKDMERKLMDCKAGLANSGLDAIKPDSISPLKILLQKIELRSQHLRESSTATTRGRASPVPFPVDGSAHTNPPIVRQAKDAFTSLFSTPRVQDAVRQLLLSNASRLNVDVSSDLCSMMGISTEDVGEGDALDCIERKEQIVEPTEDLEAELLYLLASVPSHADKKKSKKTPRRRRVRKTPSKFTASKATGHPHSPPMLDVEEHPAFYVTDDGSRIREVVRKFVTPETRQKIRANRVVARLSRPTVSSRMAAASTWHRHHASEERHGYMKFR